MLLTVIIGCPQKSKGIFDGEDCNVGGGDVSEVLFLEVLLADNAAAAWSSESWFVIPDDLEYKKVLLIIIFSPVRIF